MISGHSPGPKPREVKLFPFESDSKTQMIDPVLTTEFTGFIFKIQANMDKKHRDRVAFMRVCSGKFSRNQKIYHVRSEKELKIATPLMFQAERSQRRHSLEISSVYMTMENFKLVILLPKNLNLCSLEFPISRLKYLIKSF